MIIIIMIILEYSAWPSGRAVTNIFSFMGSGFSCIPEAQGMYDTSR